VQPYIPHKPYSSATLYSTKTIQQCNLIFHINNTAVQPYIPQKPNKIPHTKYPEPPKLNTRIKIHKPNNSIRPVVDNTKAPTYRIGKKLNNIIKQELINQYNLQNSKNFAHNITELKINEHHRMITFDIKDLYVNIPIEETLAITKQQLLNNKGIHITEQIITCLRTIFSHNYFEFQNNIYHPKNGVAMGSPISGTIAELMLQHIENQHIKHLIETGNITYYTRYVDDMFIVYNNTKTTIEEIQSYTDRIHKNLKFTITQENSKQIFWTSLSLDRNKNWT
jgi:hypothetical protein